MMDNNNERVDNLVHVLFLIISLISIIATIWAFTL